MPVSGLYPETKLVNPASVATSSSYELGALPDPAVQFAVKLLVVTEVAAIVVGADGAVVNVASPPFVVP